MELTKDLLAQAHLETVAQRVQELRQELARLEEVLTQGTKLMEKPNELSCGNCDSE